MEYEVVINLLFAEKKGEIRTVYIYKGHLGSLYAIDEYQEDTYCEACGDSDWLLGTAYNKEEAWNLIKDDTDINGSGGLDYDYVQEFIKGLNFDNY